MNIRNKIGELVAKNELEAAFDFLSSLPKDQLERKQKQQIILLNSRFSRLEQDYRQGIINQEDYQLQTNQIAYSLLELVDSIKIKHDFLLEELLETHEIRKSESDLSSKVPIEKIDSVPSLEVSITPGSAPPEVIEELLARLSLLHQKMGGEGINFTLEDIFTDQTITA